MKKIFVIVISTLVLIGCTKETSPIRLNQVGFAPNQEKTATIVMDEPVSAFILNEIGDTVWIGVSEDTLQNPISGKTCQIVDFSALETPGAYTLCAIRFRR